MKAVTSLATLLIIVVIVYFVGFREGTSPSDDSPIIADQLPISFKQAYLTDYEDNKIKLVVQAETAEYYQKNKLTLVSQVAATIPSKDEGLKNTMIHAESGRIDGQTDIIRVWDNVRVEFSDGRQLFTEELFIDQRKELMYTDTAVKLISERETVRGDSMRYDLNSDVLSMTNPKAELRLNI